MIYKTGAALAWVLFGCLFLWLFSLVQLKEMSLPPTKGELFSSFVFFSYMLLGGGGGYHFLTEILSSPYTPENREVWRQLIKKLVNIMLVMLSAPIAIYVFRENLTLETAWLFSFIYQVGSLLISFWLGIRVYPIFRQIHSKEHGCGG